MVKTYEYGILFAVAGVLAFSILSLTSAKNVDLDRDSSGTLLETEKNEEYFQQQAAEMGDECGDLKSTSNVQHLSHHPAMYAECLKKVEPAVLKQATGKTLSELLGQ